MSYAYVPNVGYGPLRFGMSRSDIEAALGMPVSAKNPFEGIPVDAETRRMTKHVTVMDFADTRRSNGYPQVTLDRDKVVAFTLFDRRDPVRVGDVDLFDPDRDAVLRRLAADESTYYENGEYFFFPKAAVSLPRTTYARRLPYIILNDSAYELARLAFNGLDPSTPPDG